MGDSGTDMFAPPTETAGIFGDLDKAFRLAFLNKCEETEWPIIAEYYQRCMGEDLPEATVTAIA